MPEACGLGPDSGRPGSEPHAGHSGPAPALGRTYTGLPATSTENPIPPETGVFETRFRTFDRPKSECDLDLQHWGIKTKAWSPT